MRSTHWIATVTLTVTLFTLAACGGGSETPKTPPGAAPASTTPAAGESTSPSVELFTAADLKLGDIDPAMVTQGEKIYDVKCQACHSKGPNRIVGPGWEGVTKRREPAWIMNMIVHTDAMLSSDAEAQKLFEECLVRMPNQNLNHDEARHMLEFMRTL